MSPRVFHLVRDEDVSGVSGCGMVAEGVVFSDGRAVMRWLPGPARGISIFDSIRELESVHGHAGRTRVVWSDDSAPSQRRRVLTVLSGGAVSP